MHPAQRRKFCAIGAGFVEQGERPGAVGPPNLFVRKGAIKREAEDLEGGDCCGKGRNDGVQVWRQAWAIAEENLQFEHPQNRKTGKVERNLKLLKCALGNSDLTENKNQQTSASELQVA
jgi:hypothetical protein